MNNMLTLDEFVASVQAAAHRRRAIEQTLFGPPRRVTLPASEIDEATRAELDALAEEIVTGRVTVEPPPVALVPSPVRVDRPLTPAEATEAAWLRRIDRGMWTLKALGKRYSTSAAQVRQALDDKGNGRSQEGTEERQTRIIVRRRG